MRDISIDAIVINNKYLRVNSNTDDLQKSIKNIGLIHPLIVNRQNELVAGGRRYSALKKLGYQKVPVIVIDKNSLEQELFSIDENLVRRPLSDVDFDACLCRAKDIYEELNPKAIKYHEEITQLLEGEDRERSFSDITSDKLGISPKTIQRAIARDMNTSSKVKQARRAGEIGISHTNHLIKLDKKDQNEILPYLVDVPSKKIGDIVGDVIEIGVDKAIKNAECITPMFKEFSQLQASSKRLNGLMSKILAEQLTYDGDDLPEVLKSVVNLKKSLNELLRIYAQ